MSLVDAETKKWLLNNRERFLQIAQKQGTPLYLFDGQEALVSYHSILNSFENEGQGISIFYAIKSNPYPALLSTLVQAGCGLDVSSDRELALAISAGASKIIYTGPAKTEDMLGRALDFPGELIINLDSFEELKRMGGAAKKKGIRAKCGLRVSTKNQKGWTKFGIPLHLLSEFISESRKYNHVDLCGIHFHSSFNDDPGPYVSMLREISAILQNSLTPEEALEIR